MLAWDEALVSCPQPKSAPEPEQCDMPPAVALCPVQVLTTVCAKSTATRILVMERIRSAHIE